MKCPNCQCTIPDTARKCPICSALSNAKGKPVPAAGIPMEKILLFGGIGLGAALLLWGAALLMRPVVAVQVSAPVAAPPAPPPPPPAEVVNEPAPLPPPPPQQQAPAPAPVSVEAKPANSSPPPVNAQGVVLDGGLQPPMPQ